MSTYHYGEIVILTAIADTGWTFSNWSGDATNVTSLVTITIDTNKAVNATFTQNQYVLTLNVEGGGIVTVALTASANLGWTFAGWSGAISGTTTTMPITLDVTKIVTAIFIPSGIHRPDLWSDRGR